ncbi:CARDB domain-containing protein [Natrialbaceae archaeon A-CW3]
MSPSVTFSTLKLLVAVLATVAVVVAAVIVIGQAPAIMGVDEQPEASITFEDQTTNGTSVEIQSVSLSDGGFVVITNTAGDTVAVSEYLGAGSHENVTIEQDEDDSGELLGQLTATVHQDTTGDETYAFEETDREEDRPYIEDGYPVSDQASVTLASRDADVATDSFRVESIEVPSTASTNETVEIRAEIRNPTDVENRQHVDLRVDGEVRERNIVELEAEETSTVVFELDTADLEPGNRTIGVYTTDHGALSVLAVAYDIEPSLEVLEANESVAVVNATLPEDGFLTVENEDNVLRGMSENLSAGDHENVTIEFDAEAGDETLYVVLYAGDPDGYDEETGFPDADPITVDGERIDAVVSTSDDELAEE